MTEEFDPLKSKLVDSLGAICADIYRGLKGVAKEQKAAVLNAAQNGFLKLARESYERRSKVKTVLDSNISVGLSEIFVPPRLSLGADTIAFETLLDGLKPGSRAVVVGTAGAGKSMMMKAALLHIIDFWAGPIPLFVELRTLNGRPVSDEPLLDLITETVGAYVRGFDKERVEDALYTGKFMLLLDALDEVDSGIRPSVVGDILRLSEKNRATIVVVSSRPDKVFSSWEEFQVYEINGLSQAECAQIVAKLPYKNVEELKPKFLTEIIGREFERHREFLSVPLLLVMMLLVYRSFAEVPDKIINFYKRAFDTLFQEHDSMKAEGQGPYKRKIRSELALEDFARTFAAFCVASYLDKKISLTDDEALLLAGRAIASSDANCDPAAFLSDLQQCVCVLQRDGTELSFVHRSFQEYFAAIYLSRCDWPLERRLRVLRICGTRMAQDSVTKMMREIDAGIFESRWVLPAIQHILDELEAAVTRDTGMSKRSIYARDLWGQFTVTYSGNTMIRAEWSEAALSRLCEFLKYLGFARPSRLLDPSGGFLSLGADRAVAQKCGLVTPLPDEKDHKDCWKLSYDGKQIGAWIDFFERSETGSKLERDVKLLATAAEELMAQQERRKEREEDLLNPL